MQNSSLVATYSCADGTQHHLRCVGGGWEGGQADCQEEGQREPRDGVLNQRSGFEVEVDEQNHASHASVTILCIAVITLIF